VNDVCYTNYYGDCPNNGECDSTGTCVATQCKTSLAPNYVGTCSSYGWDDWVDDNCTLRYEKHVIENDDETVTYTDYTCMSGAWSFSGSGTLYSDPCFGCSEETIDAWQMLSCGGPQYESTCPPSMPEGCATADAPNYHGVCDDPPNVFIPDGCDYEYTATHYKAGYIYDEVARYTCQDGTWYLEFSDTNSDPCSGCQQPYEEQWYSPCEYQAQHDATCEGESMGCWASASPSFKGHCGYYDGGPEDILLLDGCVMVYNGEVVDGEAMHATHSEYRCQGGVWVPQAEDANTIPCDGCPTGRSDDWSFMDCIGGYGYQDNCPL
jgi:hypothetical protein